MGLGHRLPVTKGVLVNLDDSSQSLVFQYNPPEWMEDKNPNYAVIDIPGLSEPLYQFINGGEKIINFELFLNSWLDKGGLIIRTVEQQLEALRSMVTPTKQSTDPKYSATAPPLVLFQWGSMLPIKCIVTGLSIVHRMFHPNTMKTMRATVQVSLSKYIESLECQ